MEENIILIISIAVAALLLGIIAGKFIFAKNTQRRIEEAELQAKSILSDAEMRSETLKKEKMIEAKEKFIQLKAEHEKEVIEKNRKINDTENRIRQKEQALNQKMENLEKEQKETNTIRENLNKQIELVNFKKQELEKHQEEHLKVLEKISGFTAEEAKAQLIEILKR